MSTNSSIDPGVPPEVARIFERRVWQEVDQRRFINRRFGISDAGVFEADGFVFREVSWLVELAPPLFFDVSPVYAPADRVVARRIGWL